MQIKLTTSQVQKQILSPSMQQSIEILLLPLTELSTTIEQELQNNPLLEIDEERQQDNPAGDDNLHSDLDHLLKGPDLPYFQDGIYEESPDGQPIRDLIPLEDDLLRQLRTEFPDPLEQRIGELLIGNINEDGYLTITCDEIAQILGLTDTGTVENVLARVQRLEPRGIAARDLKECLLAQLPEPDPDRPSLVHRIIQDGLPELGQRNLQKIARKFKVPLSAVQQAAHSIAQLEPRPARNHRPIRGSIYIKPDITLTIHDEHGYQTHLSREGIPHLRINQTYRNLLKKGRLTPEEKEFLRERLQNALLFLRSIKQRGHTVKAIADYVIDRQREFFINGHTALVPMSLKDVAQALDRNESTISRAVSNKYIDTPAGLFPLKFFFSQAVGATPGRSTADDTAGISNRSIKETIKTMVQDEDKSAPLSDSAIQSRLKAQGITVARRTVAKYRQLANILPANLRKH